MFDAQLLTAQEEVSVSTERLLVLGEKSLSPAPGSMAPGQFRSEEPIAMETGSPDSQPARETASAKRGLGTFMGTAMCRLGIHRGPWAFTHEGNCNQLRDCARCAASDTRTRHKRHWRYVLEKTCEQERTCQRCGTGDKNRTRHERWGASYSVGQDREAHKCQRCGLVESWDTASEYNY